MPSEGGGAQPPATHLRPHAAGASNAAARSLKSRSPSPLGLEEGRESRGGILKVRARFWARVRVFMCVCVCMSVCAYACVHVCACVRM